VHPIPHYPLILNQAKVCSLPRLCYLPRSRRPRSILKNSLSRCSDTTDPFLLLSFVVSSFVVALPTNSDNVCNDQVQAIVENLDDVVEVNNEGMDCDVACGCGLVRATVHVKSNTEISLGTNEKGDR
jgi:hypothetical protein